MIDAAGYVKSEKYRAEFPFFPEDRCELTRTHKYFVFDT